MASRSISRASHASHTAPRLSGGWRWALLGALLGAVFTVVLNAPARWLAAALDKASAGHLLLTHARGTVWNGNAGVVLASGAGGAESISLPANMQWTLRPRWGGFSATLDLPCCTTEPLGLRASPRAGGLLLTLQDSRSNWPAALLAGLGTPWNTLRLDGILSLSTRTLALQWEGRRLAITGGATLQANDISSRLSTLRPMGSYQLTLEGGEAPSLLLVSREGSSLRLDGSGRWTGTALRFSGEASAAPGSEAALSNLLNIIGRRDGARTLITLG